MTRRFGLALFAYLVAFLGFARASQAHTAFVRLFDYWKYEASGTDLGTAWRMPGYDDAAWPVGESPLGEASGSYEINFKTEIPIDEQTTYFRIAFDVDVPASALTTVTFTVGYAHGFVAYLNGQEIARRSMPAGAIGFSTPATLHVPMALEPIDIPDPASLFVSGSNVLAVEVHQTDPPTDVMVWAAQLGFSTSTEHVTRGPFLQMATPTSILVKWRTSVPTDGVVHYGTAATRLSQTASVPGPTTEHEVTLTGLEPATEYHYAVASSDAILAGGDGEHSFVTSPPIGTGAPTRMWVVGDSGTQHSRERQVRDGYFAFTGARRTDLWLLLGDNAYGEGTDEQYQFSMFEGMYEPILRTAAAWPTIGNHDWQEGVDVPYFEVFTLPTQGESGGVPSGTERYYSFDHANVHFVSIHTDVVQDEAMMAWIEQDVAATTQPWIIAFLHKPPYTKGSHDSDHEGDLDWVHVSVNPILEAHGVDLVLGGHSHVYERSPLIDGHYGPSFEYADDPAAFTIDAGDGREDGDGAYEKPATRGPHQGTVYTVVGNSGGRGDFGEFALDHPAMLELTDPHLGTTARGMIVAGSMVVDVDGGRLDAYYVDFEGTVLDSFTILKGSGDPGGGTGGSGASGASGGDAGPPATARSVGGCGCRAAGGDARAPWVFALAVAGVAARRARRREARRAR